MKKRLMNEGVVMGGGRGYTCYRLNTCYPGIQPGESDIQPAGRGRSHQHILRDVCKSGQIEDRELYVDLLENRFLNFISKMSRPGGYKGMSSILADQ